MIMGYKNLTIKYSLFLIVCFCVGCVNEIIPNKNLGKSSTLSEKNIKDLKLEKKKILDFVDKTIRQLGVKSLRKTEPNAEDLEIRIWVGIGYPTLGGLILGRRKNKWKANYFPTFETPKKAKPPRMLTLDRPSIGWENLWSKLKDQDIVTNRDDSEVGVVEPFEDSTLVMIEVLVRGHYRNYSYHAPCYSDAKEAKKLLKALTILEEAFNVNLHNCDEA